jgi:acyl carrier protein
MTPDQIRAAVLRALGKVAPETDPGQIDPRAPLRDQLDIDSMDFLRFVITLHSDLGVDVSERDYPKLATLDGCVSYLSTTLTAPSAGT